MPQTKYRLLFLAFLFLLSVLIIPDTGYATNNPYKIEINKRTNHLYLYKHDQVIKTYRVGTGKTKDLTPEGVFTVGSRAVNPVWRDSETNKIIPGGHPDNPLGKYWLGLKIHENDPAQTYGIHGTNNEASVPGHVSKGCIRLKNAHIKELYVDYNIAIGTPVWIHSGVSNHQWLNHQQPEEEIRPISIEVITTARVNIRQGLSTSTPAIGQVNQNTKLTVTGETSNWYRVQLANGRIGFVSKAYVRLHTEANDSTQQPNPNPNPEPKPDQKETTLPVEFNTTLTKDGALKIQASLPNVKQATGNWKVTLNGKTVVNEQSTKTSLTFLLKNPDLNAQQLQVSVTFNGTADGQKKVGVKNHTYKKVESKLTITPTFQANQLRLQASLKNHQQAVGIWIIQLGETRRVVLQNGNNLDQTFDEVTFNKDHFPVKIEFKGFTTQLLVTAKYEKTLKVNLPIDLDHNKEKENETTTENQEEQTTDEQNTHKIISQNGEQTNYQAGAKQKENEDDEEKVVENNQTSNKKGGPLPKTATNYPLGLLIGLGILLIGIGSIQLLRLKKE